MIMIPVPLPTELADTTSMGTTMMEHNHNSRKKKEAPGREIETVSFRVARGNNKDDRQQKSRRGHTRRASLAFRSSDGSTRKSNRPAIVSNPSCRRGTDPQNRVTARKDDGARADKWD